MIYDQVNAKHLKISNTIRKRFLRKLKKLDFKEPVVHGPIFVEYKTKISIFFK